MNIPLSYFQSHKKTVVLLSVILLIGFISLSFSIANAINISSDFTVFWQAGKNFIANLSLYSNIGGAKRYIYPPFAAMLFQLLGIFSLYQAAVIFSIFNCLFWVLILYYTRKILLLTSATTKQVNYSLVIGFLLSFRYFWYHLNFIQMNELVLLLTLAGVYNFLKNKNHFAIPLLVIATFIKILPILILIWALSKSNFKNYLRTAIWVLFCMLAPVMFRGIHQGVADISDYYTTFLEPFTNGRIEPELQNYGLAAALFKMFSYTPDGDKYHFIVTQLSTPAITFIYKSLLVFSFVAFISLLSYSRFIAKKISLVEVGFILMFTHLLSGITWEYHLITLIFVIPLLFLNFLNTVAKYKWFYYILGGILLFNSLIGADTVGFYLFYKCCGYSLLTWMLLFLEIYFFLIYFISPKNRLEIITD